jgi:subtilisin
LTAILASPAGAMLAPERPEKKETVSPAKQEFSIIPGHYIVVFKDSVDKPGNLARAQTDQRDGELGFVYHALNGYSAELSRGAVEALRDDPRVKYITPDQRGHFTAQEPSTGVSRVFATSNPALDIDEEDDVRIDADIAIIDSGVSPSHPDLDVAEFVDCTIEAETCLAEQGDDELGHGTHVAGIAGAIDNDFGVVGIAPGSRLWSVRIGKTAPDLSATIAGIEWVTSHADDIEVANMSLGFGLDPLLAEAIAASVEAGVVYVVSAGNENSNASTLAPANHPDVITVSALADLDGLPGGISKEEVECVESFDHPDDRLALFSNWGSTVELAAPGVCINSTFPVGGSILGKNYGGMSGTSMASPHVAGAAAILASKSNPETKKDVEAIRQALIDEGSLNWVDDTGDGAQEPLLDLRPPTAETFTTAATDLQTTSARLNGVANPAGVASSYRFEYGLTDKYGSSAPGSPKSIGSGIKDLIVSETITVKPDTTYHYRVVMTRGKETLYGADKTLKTSQWAVQSVPKFPNKNESLGQLRDVSCASSTDCIAVGSKWLGTGVKTFATHWNGSEWSLMTTPNPPVLEESVEVELERVSCSSANSCMAIGRVMEPITPFSMYWDGSKWTLASFPIPGGAVGVTKLRDVSCTSSTSCVAVGAYPTEVKAGSVLKQSTLVETWNGKEWAIQSSPNVEGNNLSALEAVSCNSATVCTAVGSTKKALSEGQTVPLAESWNGSKWSIQATPAAPSGSGTVQAISCRSASFCMATGADAAKAGFTTSWDGTKWTLRSSGLPPGFIDVSCAFEDSCDIAGRSESPSGFGRHWNGSEWLEEDPAPPVSEKLFILRGISCPPPGSCIAVGHHWRTRVDGAAFGPLAEHLPTWWTKTRFSFAFGKNGIGNGEFKAPNDLAFDSTGNLWVTDFENNRLQKFNPKGEYLSQFGQAGESNGQLKSPRGIAIDSEGNLWVVDRGNNRVQKFNSKGEYLSQFGKKGSGNGQFGSPSDIAIDPSGNLWVVDQGNNRIQKFNSKGEYQSQFGTYGSGKGQFEGPYAIAIDPDGDLWVVEFESENNRVQKFNPKGEYLSQFATPGAASGPLGIAIDSERNIWVSSITGTITQFFPEGEAVSQFGKSGSGEGQFQVPFSVAVDSAGDIWVTDKNNQRVQKWIQPELHPINTGAATQVKRTEATLNATIDPEGIATSYQFEYGPTTAYGMKAPISPKSIGSGSASVKVSEALSGLKANTTYHYRVAAITEKGTTYGADRRFATLMAAGAGAKWRIGGKTLTELGLKEAAFVAEGKFTIEFPTLSATYKCNQTGEGTISSAEAVVFHMTLSSCTREGFKECGFLDPVKMDVNGSFGSLNEALGYLEAEGCLKKSTLYNGTGSFEFGSEALAMNVTGLHQTVWGTLKAPATLSGSMHWQLSGANVGKTLGFW